MLWTLFFDIANWPSCSFILAWSKANTLFLAVVVGYLPASKLLKAIGVIHLGLFFAKFLTDLSAVILFSSLPLRPAILIFGEMNTYLILGKL